MVAIRRPARPSGPTYPQPSAASPSPAPVPPAATPRARTTPAHRGSGCPARWIAPRNSMPARSCERRAASAALRAVTDDRDIREARGRAASAPPPAFTAMMLWQRCALANSRMIAASTSNGAAPASVACSRLAQRDDRLGVQHHARRLVAAGDERVPGSARPDRGYGCARSRSRRSSPAAPRGSPPGPRVNGRASPRPCRACRRRWWPDRTASRLIGYTVTC